MVKKSLILSLLIIISIFNNCGRVDHNDPRLNPASTSPYTFTYTGQGTDITPIFTFHGGVLITHISFQGEGNFIVHLWSLTTGGVVEYLVNEIGTWSGTIPVSAIAGDYFIEICSDGVWEVQIEY